MIANVSDGIVAPVSVMQLDTSKNGILRGELASSGNL
jgi:hypothetical protein